MFLAHLATVYVLRNYAALVLLSGTCNYFVTFKNFNSAWVKQLVTISTQNGWSLSQEFIQHLPVTMSTVIIQ